MTAPTTSAAPPPAFRDASGHHYHAARLAADRRLTIAADHSAGLAAECAIKAILLDYLGSRLNDKQRPYSEDLKLDAQLNPPGGKRRKQPRTEYLHEHLPELWGQLTTLLDRRRARETGTLFLRLIGHNPFHDWNVADRYGDGTAISDADLRRHLRAAYELLAAHEQARVLGTGALA
ncbi:hypothetical protein PJ985_14490 [Streptomyces sp. ACA25]|uniref:hypothetical protein n=1 Tax=Streptomyces sp. ACA25 TaxID=3022596 RepID=UPI0023076FC3|nr:hypothetical protein [Streptomyces sp. ACA25]MDB1088773.1 hypothetical protein [Streptomyces sp. ACA25]